MKMSITDLREMHAASPTLSLKMWIRIHYKDQDEGYRVPPSTMA